MDEAELFYGLYFLAVQNEFQTPAGFAVGLLYHLNPACQISCEEAIRALLSEWNVSTSDLPFYLVKQFGKARMRDAINQIRVGPLTKDEKVLLNTVEYWVDLANDDGSY